MDTPLDDSSSFEHSYAACPPEGHFQLEHTYAVPPQIRNDSSPKFMPHVTADERYDALRGPMLKFWGVCIKGIIPLGLAHKVL